MKELTTLSEYDQERYAICEQLASEYLTRKERKKCYQVRGKDWEDWVSGERPCSIFIPLTDEYVAALKAEMIEVANELCPEDPVHSWEEFSKYLSDIETFNFWETLDSKADSRFQEVSREADSHGIVEPSIDLDNVHYLYRFSFYYFDDEQQQMTRENYFEVLSDEEYVQLLALQLSLSRGFTYNNLFSIDPELARRLNDNIDYGFFEINCHGSKTKPFVILFDEITEDAKGLQEEAQKRLLDRSLRGE